MKVKTLSFQECPLLKIETQDQVNQIVESLKHNLSLCTILLSGTCEDRAILDLIEKEIALNRDIVKNVFPKLIN